MPTQLFPHTILPELVGVTDESLAAQLPEASPSVKGMMPAAALSKIDGIESGATANSSDASLRDRSTHTGQQASSTITGLATVATSGSYLDLANKPSIPAAQVNADWNSTSNPSQILNKPTRSFNNTPGRSLVSVAAAANGFQIDASRDALASYSVSITSASSLSGGSAGYVVLEICSTNSATAGNWIEISRCANGQNNALIIGLALSQVGGGPLNGVVPAGWYARLRTVNTTGTPTYTYNSGQEVKL